MGENHFASLPTALYGVVGLAFVHPAIAGGAIYVFVALMWLVPDRRIESVLLPAGRPLDGPD